MVRLTLHGNEWRSREHPQRAGNTGTDVRCRRWRSVDTEPSRTRAGLMFSKEGIRLLAYGTPKLIFRELLRRAAFSEQGVQFFRYSCETRHRALFNGCQSSLDNLLNGIVSTAVEDSSNPALLFRGEMNRHGVAGPWVRHLQGRGKNDFRQVEYGFVGFVFGRSAH